MPEYPVGGPVRGRGAVVETYVDTNALDVSCPACGVGVGEFCRWESGHQRRMPCPQRIKAAARNDAQKASSE